MQQIEGLSQDEADCSSCYASLVLRIADYLECDKLLRTNEEYQKSEPESHFSVSVSAISNSSQVSPSPSVLGADTTQILRQESCFKKLFRSVWWSGLFKSQTRQSPNLAQSTMELPHQDTLQNIQKTVEYSDRDIIFEQKVSFIATAEDINQTPQQRINQKNVFYKSKRKRPEPLKITPLPTTHQETIIFHQEVEAESISYPQDTTIEARVSPRFNAPAIQENHMGRRKKDFRSINAQRERDALNGIVVKEVKELRYNKRNQIQVDRRSDKWSDQPNTPSAMSDNREVVSPFKKKSVHLQEIIPGSVLPSKIKSKSLSPNTNKQKRVTFSDQVQMHVFQVTPQSSDRNREKETWLGGKMGQSTNPSPGSPLPQLKIKSHARKKDSMRGFYAGSAQDIKNELDQENMASFSRQEKDQVQDRRIKRPTSSKSGTGMNIFKPAKKDNSILVPDNQIAIREEQVPHFGGSSRLSRKQPENY